MKAFCLRLTAIAVAITSTLAVTPAQAFQMPSAPAISASNPVSEVQYREGWRDRDRRDHRWRHRQ